MTGNDLKQSLFDKIEILKEAIAKNSNNPNIGLVKIKLDETIEQYEVICSVITDYEKMIAEISKKKYANRPIKSSFFG